MLPEVERYQPSGTGESPLATIPSWVHTTDPETGRPAKRETNTMPQWAGSCWYYLRYIDPHNEGKMVDPELEKYWMPVDLYVGGVEHAVLHLLYARFWHKVLYDVGAVSTKEPFQRLVNQGMILGFAYRYFTDEAGQKVSHREATKTDAGWKHKADGRALKEAYVPLKEVKQVEDKHVHPEDPSVELEVLTEKMSKSRGNVVNPDEIVAEHGADSLRLYEMFMGPLEQVKPWNTQDIWGVRRFLSRFWRSFIDQETGLASRVQDIPASEEVLRALHKTIKKVSEDTEAMRFNTAIAAMMEFTHELARMPAVPREVAEQAIILLSPYAPHIAEELWARLGHAQSLAYAAWPAWDEALVKAQSVGVGVQLNGKLRDTLEVPVDITQEAILALAKSSPKIAPHLEGKTLVREIYVPGRIVNLVVK
jgi:leucyl-tRNA synthetase